MQTYQQYIDDIQGAVYSPETADPDFLRDSAAMYAEACAEANDRLRNVGRLLHRGLRSEAIQFAEQEPNLLDMVAMLDFQELPEWREMLVDWGMAEPPRLLIDLAADLNKAYADQQPLESLLRQHRILALGRAPLSARIHTLRRIRDADEGNDTWTADLVIFEKARLKQIGAESDAARRSHDLGALTNLAEELRAKGWMVDRPRPLMESVESARARVAAAAARKTLERIDEELNAAHMAFDAVAGKSLRAEWQAAAGVAGLAPTDELSQRAAPALDWLAEQDQQQAEQHKFATAIAVLQQAVNDNSPEPRLRRLYHAAAAFDEPLPPGLLRRVEQRLGDYELQVRRRRRLIITSACGVLLLLGAAVGYIVLQQAHAKNVTDAAATLAQMIDKSRYAEAEQYFDDLRRSSPRVALSAEVQQHKSTLDELKAADKDRLQRFAAAIELAESTPLDAPNRQAIADAKKNSKSDLEHERVAALEARVDAVLQQRRQEQGEALAKRLTALRESLAPLERNAELGNQERLAALQKLRGEIESAQQAFPMAEPAMLAQANPLRSRVDTLLVVIRARERQEEARADITRAVGDFPKYWSSLDAYGKAFPETALATNIESLSRERPLWEGLAEWSAYLKSTFDDGWPKTAEAARKAILQGDVLVAKYESIPLAEYYRSRKPYLESIAAREPESGIFPLDDLRRLFSDPLISKLWMVSDRFGQRYYMRAEPVEKEASFAFSYLAGFDLSEKPGSVQTSTITYRGPAPQSEVASKAAAALEQLPSRGWEASFATILQSAADPKNDVDPILRLILLQRILDTAALGSSVLDQGFREYRDALGNANIDLSVPWMAPRDVAADKERQRAQIIVDGLPPVADAMANAARRLKEIQQPSGSNYSWVGWLAQDQAGKWSVAPPVQHSDRGDLVVITQAPAEKSATVEVVGAFADGETRMAPSAPGAFLEGRPVFLHLNK